MSRLDIGHTYGAYSFGPYAWGLMYYDSPVRSEHGFVAL